VSAEPLRVVIVDDHGVVRRGVRALIETHPAWRVVGEGATGREAVELVRHLRPHVVVLDLSMPEMNGLEATRQIVTESPQTEVLVLTMHHSEQLARDVLQAGARGYLLKSDADQNLIAAVDSLRQHKPFLTSTVTEFVLDGYMQSTDGADDAETLPRVTPREREVTAFAAQGRSTKQIASALGISPFTVQDHLKAVFAKVGVQSRAELVAALYVRHYEPRRTAGSTPGPYGWYLDDYQAAAG